MTVEVASKIVKQVEFYFSDSNLPRDKFLLAHIKENNGWASLATITLFSRMKALTDDVQSVADALSTSTVLELNDDKTMIRRIEPLADSLPDTMPRTVHAAGLPTDATLSSIEDFFAQHATVKAVRFLRDHKSKAFKGAVFVEVATAEEAEKLVGLELVYADAHPLTIHTKANYFELKNAERTGLKTKSDKRMPSKELGKEFVKDCLVCISGIAENTTHQEIKAAFEANFVVAFAEIHDGSAMVRFKEPVASAVVEFYGKEENPLKIGSAVRLASDDEERVYYENLARQMAEKNTSFANKRHPGAGGKRGPFKKNFGKRKTAENDPATDNADAPKRAKADDE